MADPTNPPELEIVDSMPSGLKVTSEQPYRILLVSNLTGSCEGGSLTGPLNDGVVEVTADAFDEMMSAASPTVSFKTTDPVASGNVMVEVNLRFDSTRAFHPKQLVEQFPATKSLMSIRREIAGRMHGKISSDELAKAVAEAVSTDPGFAWLAEAITWTPAEPAADPGAVDSLLGQLDLGDSEEESSGPPPKSPIGSIIAAATQDGSSIPSEEASALRRTLGEIDRRVSAWLTMILHAPEFQSIESAWRSLAFVISQMNFRKGLRLAILHTPPGTLLERFRSRLIDPVFDEGADAPNVIVVDAQFGNTAADMDALDELAQHGASLPVVVLTGISSAFFGVKNAWQIATLPTIANMFDQWQFAKWKAIRDEPYARSLGVLFGRCLLRAPYDRDEEGGVEFGYKEPVVGEKDFLWASGAIAAAVTIARSVADTTWPTAMAGFVHGRVEGFATAMGGKKGDKPFGPTDTQLVQAKIEEMAAIGVSAAVGIRDHDDAIVWNGLSAGRPIRMDANALLEVSLPYQLFATRLSSLLFLLKPHLSGLGAPEIEKTVRVHVCQWLGFKEEPDSEQLSVQTRPAEDSPGTLELAVTVTPPQKALPGGIPIVMGYRLN
ncbi:MAG: type VI secretion system contractile sheath large subunit [Planctomycetes bacterium]|nr:type VI secretion system contractile sheath large subunit [Planctomycetota bacterium]